MVDSETDVRLGVRRKRKGPKDHARLTKGRVTPATSQGGARYNGRGNEAKLFVRFCREAGL
jgi:hypothetical protein